jgi:hypothetical protein
MGAGATQKAAVPIRAMLAPNRIRMRLFIAASPLREIDEAIEHPLTSGMLEIDLELVTFDLGHLAVAELGVENALAHRDIASPWVAEAYR